MAHASDMFPRISASFACVPQLLASLAWRSGARRRERGSQRRSPALTLLEVKQEPVQNQGAHMACIGRVSTPATVAPPGPPGEESQARQRPSRTGFSIPMQRRDGPGQSFQN